MSAPSAQPGLKRALGLPGLTLFGLTYMTAVTVFTTYGIVNEITGGRLPAAYVVAVVTMLFTAASYGAMVKKYPIAGSAYTYTQQAFGGGIGFITGWVLLLDYLFLPMINFMLIGIYLNTQFPGVPAWVFTLSGLVIVLGFNLLGITLVNRVNAVIITLSLILIAVFIALAIKTGLADPNAPGVFEPFLPGEDGIGPIFSGAAVLALSFLGFDAVSTLAEEAKRPRIDIPRAIILSTLIGGAIFIAVSWAGAMAYPDWTAFDDLDSAGVTVMTHVGGEIVASIFVAVFVAGSFGSGMTSQVSVSRIIYAMGRDGSLPRVFARMWATRGTPIVATVTVSAFALLSLVLTLDQAAHMISFGALAAFSMVNLGVIRVYLFPRGGRRTAPTAWEWCRFGVMPLIGFALTIWLWTSLSPSTFLIGGIWIVMGLILVAVATKGFRRPVPKMDFTEQIQVIPTELAESEPAR